MLSCRTLTLRVQAFVLLIATERVAGAPTASKSVHTLRFVTGAVWGALYSQSSNVIRTQLLAIGACTAGNAGFYGECWQSC